MNKWNSIFSILLLTMLSCNNENDVSNKNTEQTNKNKYNSNETYSYGNLTLVTETNLPLTGFVLYYDSKEGFLSSKSYYVNGLQNGYGNYYYKNGSLSSRINYLDGEINGWCNRWFENGRLSYDCFYNHGKLDGVSKEWFENGQIKEISHYENGLRIGWQREYLENGTILYEVNLVNGNGEIAYVVPNTNFQIKEKYIGGKEVAPISGKVYEKGIVEIIHETSYENGERNGLMRRFYLERPNQKPTEFNYKNGLKHGANKYWFENGHISSQEEYFFDQIDGLSQRWHENGQLAQESKYDRGILVSKKCWDESGKTIECQCYNNNGDKIKCP
jgi:antitoxin component YwqK of YwqJK toxin-antitoxin module